MIFTIARRNLWRNKRRTLILLSSVIAGVVALIINDSVGNGFVNQMLDNQINLHTSHIQIHKKGFNDNKMLNQILPDYREVESILKNNTQIKNFSRRTIAFGLVNSANASSGVNIIGINPNMESKITNISSSVIDGKYPSKFAREVLIGRKMSDKLEVGIGDKVVVVTNSSDGNVKSELFRISGVFKAGSTDFENAYIFVPEDYASSLLELNAQYHEIALIAKSRYEIDNVKYELTKALGDDYEVLSYKDLQPMLVSYIEIYDKTKIVFYAIIGMAVLFGIINTMLMSVFERVQEFGVLMAIGMKTRKIYFMVILESFIIGIIGSIVGFVFGMIIYLILAKTGIDLGSFSESLNSFGLNSMVYPEINFALIRNSLLVMPLTSVIGALYPAFKAIKLQPTDAMRYV